MKQTERKGNRRYSRLKVIWFFLGPYRLPIILLFLLSLVIGVLESTCVATLYPLLSAGFDIEAGQSSIIFSLLEKMAMMFPVEDIFIAYCIFFILIATSAFILNLINVFYRTRIASDIVSNNQSEVFKKYMGADYQYYVDHRQGEYLYTTSTAPASIASLVTTVNIFLSQAVLTISILVLLFSISWRGAILVLLVGIGYYFFTSTLGEKVSYAAGRGRAEAGKELAVVLNETFTGIREIKIFVTMDSWINKFISVLKPYWGYWRKAVIWGEIPRFVLMFLFYLIVGVMLLILKIQNPTGFTQLIPLFGTFGFAVLRLLPIMSALGAAVMGIMTELPRSELVYSIQTEKLSNIKDGKKELKSFQSNIQFDKVSFSHKRRLKTIGDVSITFEKGKTTAIVGASGVGKTTIIDLVLRLFDPDKGEIKIDGINIKEYKLSSWLSKIGFVGQETFIFNDSVKNNITFGSDKYSNEGVIKAASNADAHNFILDLPEGYDTTVGDRGARLSGGQRQRIAIARAIIREPEILIFDEATSALDNVSEALVQEAINKISRDYTVIIVAHRLSTIINADKIMALENGRIVEEGTHKELMKNKGVYWNLYKNQANM